MHHFFYLIPVLMVFSWTLSEQEVAQFPNAQPRDKFIPCPKMQL